MDFYAVNIDLGEGLSSLVRFRDGRGHPWPVAQAPAGLLPDYNIRQTSSKVAIDRNGLIVFTKSYSEEASDTWRQLFQELSQA